MSDKDTMICDIETGICGPVGEDNSYVGLIDLTALSTDTRSDLATELTEKDHK